MLLRNIKLRNKLCLLAAAQSFFLLIFSLLLVQHQFEQQQTEQYTATNKIMQLYIQAINDQLRRLDERSMEFICNGAVQADLAGWADNTALAAANISGNLLIMLHRNYSSTPILRSAELYESSHRYVVSTNAATFSPQDAELLRIWNKAEVAKGAQIYHASPDYPDDVLIARIVRKVNRLDLSHLGLFLTRVSISNLVNLFAGTDADERIVIFASDQPLYDPDGYAMYLSPIQSEYEIRSINGERMMITSYVSQRTGWRYYCLKPQTPMDQRQRALLFTTFGTLAAISAAVFMVAALIARQVTQPIDEIIRLMSREGTSLLENAPYQLKIRKDEVGTLYVGFRSMLEQLQVLIRDNYEIKLSQQDVQLKALQAQINPHLLYNTLNAIQWSARMEGNEIIGEVTNALGSLLHAALSFDEPIVTLKEELALLSNYLIIQRFRFGNRLQDTQSIAQETLAVMVPKLSLQPIVDNAISHGIRSNPGITEVSVTSRIVDGWLWLDVMDNGSGIPGDLIEQLKRGERQPTGMGIGLINIEERLQLLFHDRAKLLILADLEHGAHIRLVIPLDTASQRTAGKKVDA